MWIVHSSNLDKTTTYFVLSSNTQQLVCSKLTKFNHDFQNFGKGSPEEHFFFLIFGETSHFKKVFLHNAYIFCPLDQPLVFGDCVDSKLFVLCRYSQTFMENTKSPDFFRIVFQACILIAPYSLLIDISRLYQIKIN